MPPNATADSLIGSSSILAESSVGVGSGDDSDSSPGEILMLHSSSRVNSSPKSLVTVMGGQENPGGGDSDSTVLVTELVVVTVLDAQIVVVVRVGGQFCLAFNSSIVVVLVGSAGDHSSKQSSPSSKVSPRSFVTVRGEQLNSGCSSSSSDSKFLVTVTYRVRVRVNVDLVV